MEQAVAMTDDEAVALGREVVQDGRLKSLRESLGLSPNAMAELLYTAWPTYRAWESRPVNLRKETAARVGRFYQHATLQLQDLDHYGINIRDMVPFHIVATLLGIPQEQLFNRYREGRFEATDLGLLGLWMLKTDLDELRR
jgi:hypothetical protein